MDLYYSPASAHCRSVIMAAAAVDVELNKKFLNLSTREQMKPDFVKLNPQHTIPTLVDGDFAIWESRAIMIYLVEQYGKTDALYPKCPKTRAIINQRLYFDMGTLYQSFADYYFPQCLDTPPGDPEKFKKMETAFEFFDKFLEGNQYAVGNTMTLADLALLASVSTFDVARFNFRKYSNVAKWYDNIKNVAPGAGENWDGCLLLKHRFANV